MPLAKYTFAEAPGHDVQSSSEPDWEPERRGRRARYWFLGGASALTACVFVVGLLAFAQWGHASRRGRPALSEAGLTAQVQLTADIGAGVANTNVVGQVTSASDAELVSAQASMVAEQGPPAVTMQSVAHTLEVQSAGSVDTSTREMYSRQAPVGVGTVAELYTFGSPGTGHQPLYSAVHPNGCIPGVRTYTKGTRFSPGSKKFYQIADPVAWITNLVKLQHPLMDSMEAWQGNHLLDSGYGCGDGTMEPKEDGFFWIKGHMIYPRITEWHENAFENATYTAVAPNILTLNRRLQQRVTVPGKKVKTAQLMAHFAFMNYKANPMIAADANDWGWSFVGRACSVTNHGPSAGVLGLSLKAGSKMGTTAATLINSCDDHTLLYQNTKTLACALVFEGSDDATDWMANLDFTVSDFCGLGHVHSGFRDKVLRMVGGLDYKQVIQTRLPNCASVTVVGHSLGGAQAELFTACANQVMQQDQHREASGKYSTDFNDYRVVGFKKGTPKLMKSFYEDQVDGGFFLRNRGSGFCIDVSGLMQTDYKSRIILYHCELPSTFAKDQIFNFTADGLLKNELTGKCVDSDPRLIGDGPVKQFPCNGTAPSQKWKLLPKGFLQNQGSGMCLSVHLKLITCPFTDQKWVMKPNGHFVNSLTQLCLDVLGGGSPSAGDKLIIWDCETHNNTDQLWELTPDGALRNKPSGLCANVKRQQGREDRPHVVLGPCSTLATGLTVSWELAASGFLRSVRWGQCLDVVGKPGSKGSAAALRPCQEKGTDVASIWEHMPGGFLKNIGNDPDLQYQCLQLADSPDPQAKLLDGTELVLQPCKLKTDQRWIVTKSGRIQNVIGGQKCIDVMSKSPSGTLWLMNCDNWSDPNLYLDRKWTMVFGTLQNRLRKTCVSMKANGRLHLTPCTEASHWSRQEDGALKDQQSGLCMSGKPLVLGVPQPLEMMPCNPLNASNQEWEMLDNGFLRSKHLSLCVSLGSTAGHLIASDALLLQECPVSTQRWQVTQSGQLRNSVTGKCMDTMRHTTGLSWWDIVMWDCDDSRNEQKWERVPY